MQHKIKESLQTSIKWTCTKQQIPHARAKQDHGSCKTASTLKDGTGHRSGKWQHVDNKYDHMNMCKVMYDTIKMKEIDKDISKTCKSQRFMRLYVSVNHYVD